MSNAPDLQALRAAIERVDEDLLDALRRRMDLAEEVARAKLALASPFRDLRREDLLLQRLRARAVALGLDPHQVERLYRLIMEMSVARQQALVASLPGAPLRVGYPGVEGSYSHLAAQQRYAGRPGGVLLSGFESAREAVEALKRGEVDVVLLPIESTTSGAVPETYDALVEEGITMTGEVVREVRHRLLGLPGATLPGLREVRAHPQALVQCEEFLRTLPGVQLHTEVDSGMAAQRVRQGNDPAVAAIASDTAAQRFGLEVLARDIQARSGDFTRFVEVARGATPLPGGVPCMTSLLVVLENRPGTLGRVLTLLAGRSVNVARLESRPIPSAPWTYRFYLDLEGHAASEGVEAALEDIRPHTTALRVLGTYPRADLPHG